MPEGRNLSFALMQNGNRKKVAKSRVVKLIMDFPQSILGLTGPNLITNKTIYMCHSTIKILFENYFLNNSFMYDSFKY